MLTQSFMLADIYIYIISPLYIYIYIYNGEIIYIYISANMKDTDRQKEMRKQDFQKLK